jgi:PilZ domain
MIISAFMHQNESNATANYPVELRVLVAGSGHLTFFKHSILVTAAAAIIDVSRSGLQLEVDEAIEPGSKIELGLQRLTVHGEVRRCSLHGPGRYRLGVRIHWVLDSATE